MNATDLYSVALRNIRGKATVHVTIIDTRVSFGRTDALVTPVSGSGQWWIDADRLQPVGEGEGE